MNSLILIILFVAGVFLSVFAGLNWHRYKIIHIFPFLYGFIIELILSKLLHFPFDYLAVAVIGLCFYVMAWIAVLQEKEDQEKETREKKP